MTKDQSTTKTYVGLDISLADTHICVLNEEGKAYIKEVLYLNQMQLQMQS